MRKVRQLKTRMLFCFYLYTIRFKCVHVHHKVKLLCSPRMLAPVNFTVKYLLQQKNGVCFFCCKYFVVQIKVARTAKKCGKNEYEMQNKKREATLI